MKAEFKKLSKEDKIIAKQKIDNTKKIKKYKLYTISIFRRT